MAERGTGRLQLLRPRAEGNDPLMIEIGSGNDDMMVGYISFG